MKKFLMMILILVLGTFTFANSKYTSSAKVTVRATIVDEELVIGGKNNKPLIIAFDNLKENNNGNLDFSIKYSGAPETVTSTSNVQMELENSNITLTNSNAKTLTSNIKLDSKTVDLKGKQGEYIGRINGEIQDLDIKKSEGIYAGITQLNITIIPM